ncbi:MAG TPA: glycosyl hydrolase family 28-related protein [Tepidisphaeraceae bacterium]|nr:glycosyl hydrolase family 28-related protein [Tepidisphaeraceae bacterium]
MAARSAAKRRSLVQTLEPRCLLSTVSVSSFGARPNDGIDDSGAIQLAINAAGSGDVVSFDAGTYNIGVSVNARGGGRILQGNGTTLQAGPTAFAFALHASGLKVTGFTFKGRGIFMDSPNGMIGDVVIDNNEFQLQATGNHRNAIEFTTGLRNTQITNNTFDPIAGDNGIYGYNWDGLTIGNNEFLNGNEGVHVIDFGDNSRNLLIEQNYFSGLHRMAVEYQGGGWNTIVQDNWYENPVMYPTFNQNNDTFAFSIVADHSHNTIIRRNVAIMPLSKDSPDKVGVRIAFEIGGQNILMEDNYAIGGNHVVAANGSHSTGIVRNNRFLNYRQGPSNANGSTVQFLNNGPNIMLTWSGSRGRPGPNKHFGGTPSTPPVTPPPTQPPTTDPVDPTDPNDPTTPANPAPTGLNAPANLVAVAINSSRIELTWTDTSTTEAGFKIERSIDGINWIQIYLPVANSTQYVDVSLPGSTKLYYRIRAFDASGNSDYSNVAAATTLEDSAPVTPTTPTNPDPDPDPTPTTPTTPTTPPPVKIVTVGTPNPHKNTKLPNGL